MTYVVDKEGYIVSVNTPLSGPDIEILRPFTVSPKGKTTHIYTPFDPEDWKLPAQVGDYKYKIVGDTVIWYSPNLHELFLKEYVKADKNGNPYFYTFPVLLVNYNTPEKMYYAGENKPPAQSIDVQESQWKEGMMWARMALPRTDWSTMEVTVCAHESYQFGCLDYKTIKYRKGWYWVGYQARLIDLPATMMAGVSDVIKFYYKKPSNFVFKIPGFSSIADYLMKRKLNNEGISQIEDMLKPFGYVVDKSTPYVTDKGNTEVGPYVEEFSDHYVVYMPVTKEVSSLGPEIGIGAVIVIVAVSVLFAVGIYYVWKITSEKEKAYQVYLNSVIDAQNNYTRCVSACNVYTDKAQKDKCLAGCKDAYQTTINEAKKAYEQQSKYNPLKDIKDIMILGIVGALVISLMGVLKRG